MSKKTNFKKWQGKKLSNQTNKKNGQANKKWTNNLKNRQADTKMDKESKKLQTIKQKLEKEKNNVHNGW